MVWVPMVPSAVMVPLVTSSDFVHEVPSLDTQMEAAPLPPTFWTMAATKPMGVRRRSTMAVGAWVSPSKVPVVTTPSRRLQVTGVGALAPP